MKKGPKLRELAKLKTLLNHSRTTYDSVFNKVANAVVKAASRI